MKEDIVIARLSAKVLLILDLIITCLLIGSIWKEMMGSGVSSSMYYRVLGPILYPIYYGACVFLIYRTTRLYFSDRRFVWKAGNDIFIARKRLPDGVTISDVEFIKGLFFTNVMVIELSNGRQIRINLNTIEEKGSSIKQELLNIAK